MFTPRVVVIKMSKMAHFLYSQQFLSANFSQIFSQDSSDIVEEYDGEALPHDCPFFKEGLYLHYHF